MSDNNSTNNAPARQRRYTDRTINEAFTQFLGIRDDDKHLLQRYHQILLVGSEEFAQVFYAYLQAYPATAEILQRYQNQGGEIGSLVKSQLQHLWSFLAGHTDAASAAHLAEIGDLHHRFGIEPVWVMGAYLLYWDFLHGRIQAGEAIPPDDRAALEDAITKFLFRDMGLMLEGYWDAAMREVRTEQEKVATLQEQITSLLANLPQTLWSVDVVSNQPLYVSPTSREICDLPIDMPIPCLGWTVPEDRATVIQAWESALKGRQVEVESRVKAPDGELRWFRRVFQPFTDDTGRVVRIDGLMEDATDAKLTLERLHTLATTDSLTGLNNRTLFLDRLNRAIAGAKRSRPAKQVVLMLMDLDHFKEINDTLGHPVGDQILRLVAERMLGQLRESDTLARLGGDEFAILLPAVDKGRKTARVVAEKILGCFREPFLLAEQELYLGAGLGIAIYPDHGEDVDILMSRADVAMYGAKHTELGHAFYDASSDPHTPQRLQLMTELRRALDHGEFVLHYQPKIDIHSGTITGVEALIRWQHPERGLIFPDDFLPAAEKTGLINAMTDWVIREALSQGMRWRAAGHSLRMAVNVAAHTFQQPHFATRVSTMIEELAAPPECLEIEITENLLMRDIDNCSKVLEALTDLGITIAIDDYGTGYSSLAYLKKLPLHTLKIDKSFVMDMPNDENDAVIVRSTIDLAHNLGYRVVAEGVEDHDTLQLLSILGCDSAQGYHISRPLTADKLGHWLTESPWVARRAF